MGMSTFAEAPPPLFGDGGRGDWAARSDVYAHAAGLSTSGRTTLPSDPSLYDPPRTSRLTRSNVKLGGDLSPFVSEVMRPQGILQEKKYEIPAARARYSKERDTPSRGESEAHKSATRAHPSLFQSNSSMSVYASTKAKLRVPEPWHDNHPHEFKRASRPSRPSDRKDMVARKTLEEARTPLERRRALEHEAALAHAEERRVAAIDDAARVVSLRRAAAAAEIKSKFSTRRDANEAIKNRTYRWEEDPERVSVSTGSVLDAGDRLKTTTPRVSKYEPVDDALDPAEALTRGARQRVPRPRVLGPCAFVPSSAEAYAEARRAKTVTDERFSFADETEALRATERSLGGVAPASKYAAYFADFARSHREAEKRAGRVAHAHTKRGTLLRRETESETQRQMRELDAFEARVEYFHENDLARRLVDRGWLREDALAFGAGSAQMSSVGDGENPQASMVRARAAADARLALANRREWTDASSEEGDPEQR
jgi:hypothetical protein